MHIDRFEEFNILCTSQGRLGLHCMVLSFWFEQSYVGRCIYIYVSYIKRARPTTGEVRKLKVTKNYPEQTSVSVLFSSLVPW